MNDIIFIGDTPESLRRWINNHGNYGGLETLLPKSIKVDYVTYANICDYIFKNEQIKMTMVYEDGIQIYRIHLGPNNGIMYKGIELILVK